MPDIHAPDAAVLLPGFFRRLDRMDAILRVIVSEARFSLSMDFRGDPGTQLFFDFAKRPTLISEDVKREGAIHAAVPATVMHDILLGRIEPGVALGRRELLLRGSPSHLAKVIPLFDFGPLLYREHLADIAYPGFARTIQPPSAKETTMSQQNYDGTPVVIDERSPFEKALSSLFRTLAFGLGFVIGWLRYRVFKRLSLFDLLGALSRGLERATPAALLDANAPESRPPVSRKDAA